MRGFSLSPKAFVRQSKLTLSAVFVLLLSLTGSGKGLGVDGQAGAFFRHARRSGLWPEAEAVHRSTVTKARAKLPWTAFEQVHHDAVGLAYALWPASADATWQGLSVFAIDGSKYDLPASPALREAFDPKSGLEHPGKGHYPQCLVSTAYDVFRRLPIARTVQSIAQADEREEVKALLPHIPAGGLLLFDRGYPSYDLIGHLHRQYQGYWVIRCPATSTFPAVELTLSHNRSADGSAMVCSWSKKGTMCVGQAQGACGGGVAKTRYMLVMSSSRWMPIQRAWAPGSPSLLRPRKPPRRATMWAA